jgi:hypothetical protein
VAGIAEIGKSEYAERAETPGKTISLEVRDALSTRTIEMMHPPGVISGPTKGDVVVTVDAGPRVRIAVASRNYKVNVEVGEGETLIYSTDRFGSTVKSTIKLDTSGNINLNGDGKKFVTHKELDTALQLFAVAVDTQLKALGQPGVTLDISAAATTTIRTDG